MIESPKTLGIKKLFFFTLVFLVATDLAIFLDIPFSRQIFGFLFLTILPGLLILQILKLEKLDFLEKFILSWGISVSFLMFFGLLLNNSSLSLGYETPLATIPLLVSFNIAFMILAIIGYKINKNTLFSLPNFNLTTSEKAFLIVPFLFPALSIFGMHVMNTTDNNIILLLLLFLIPAYVVFVCLFNQKFSKRLYPVVIFLISISLLLLMALRSNHLIGADTHEEYYFFRTTLDQLHWSVLGYSTLDACLAISLLPTIYQSILNISPEFLFKILYSLISSISPLVIYVLSKKYIGESYGFLATCFFMFQHNFLRTELHARTNIAILFFALAMMVLFDDKIDPLKKRILFIVFMASCMVSHYATAYIFFFIMLGSFLGIELLSKKYTFKKVISFTITILFFAFIFFWYSQVTETAFDAGVRFVENTLTNLNMFFVEESRSTNVQAMLGTGIMQKDIPHRIEFVFTWLMFAFIGIGIITLIRRYKEMSFPELGFKKSDILKDKFEVEYFVVTLACVGLFVAVILTPYITVRYSLDRAYLFGIVVLSVFFVIGGITVVKYLNKRLAVLHSKPSTKNAAQVRAYLIILLVMIPYFFCVTGVSYQMFGVPRAITLNSEGEQYDQMYVYDQESYGAKWLSTHTERKCRIYVDHRGVNILTSQVKTTHYLDEHSLFKNEELLQEGYIYFRYINSIQGKLLKSGGTIYDIEEISNALYKTNKIYDNDVVIYEK